MVEIKTTENKAILKQLKDERFKNTLLERKIALSSRITPPRLDVSAMWKFSVPQTVTALQPTSEPQAAPDTWTEKVDEGLKDEDFKDEIKIKREEDLPDFRETINPRKRQRTDD